MATTRQRTEDLRWDLSDLCANADEARSGWTVLVDRAKDFAAKYRGTIASLDAPAMRALLDESDELAQDLSRLQVYTYLRRSMDATDVEANDLTTIGRDRGGDIENDLRGTLRNFGLKVGMVGTVKFEARIRELVADHPDLAAIVEPLLIARRVLREQLGVLHRQLLEIVRRMRSAAG